MARRLLSLALVWPLLHGSAGAAAPCRTVTVPITVRGERPLVTVTLDRRPAVMVLDTGAYATTLLADAPARLDLALDPGRPAEQATSYGAPIRLTFARVRQVEFAGTAIATDDLPIVAGGWIEPGVDGFFIDDRAKEADYDVAHGRVRLACPPFRAPAWTRGRAVRSVTLADRPRPFGTALVNGQRVTVLFDTGSPGSSMTLAAAIRVGVTVSGPPTAGAAGLGMTTPLRAWTATLPDLRIGDEPTHAARVLIVDKPNASADMIAGFDFFADHRVWIDRRRHRLLFRAAERQQRQDHRAA